MTGAIYVNTTTTNSCNDDEQSQWNVFETTDEVLAWEKTAQERNHKWNYKTPGANSFRYTSFESFTIERLKTQTVDTFSDMPVMMFLALQKQFADSV